MFTRQKLLVFCVVILFAIMPVQGESVRTVTGGGTGFIVGSSGYILTNEHVIHDANEIEVFLEGNGPAYNVTVVRADEVNDIALLKIDSKGLPVVELGDSNTVRRLDPVLAVGFPAALQYGRDLTTADGKITAIRTGYEGRKGKETFQTDAAIYHGSSGGPLLNSRGEVIGINTYGIEGWEFYFAIPINDAIHLLQVVPSFDVSAMGGATETLSQQEIVKKVTPAVVYIRTEIAQPLERFLPNEVLGIGMKKLELWQFGSKARRTLEEYGINIEDGRRAVGSESWGDVKRVVEVKVFDLANKEIAQQSSQLLATPEVTMFWGEEWGEEHLRKETIDKEDIFFKRQKSLNGSLLYFFVRQIKTIEYKEDEYVTVCHPNHGLLLEVCEQVPVSKCGLSTGFLGAATWSLADLVFFTEFYQKRWVPGSSEGTMPMSFSSCNKPSCALRGPDQHLICKIYDWSTLPMKTLQTINTNMYLGDFTNEFNKVINQALMAVTRE